MTNCIVIGKMEFTVPTTFRKLDVGRAYVEHEVKFPLVMTIDGNVQDPELFRGLPGFDNSPEQIQLVLFTTTNAYATGEGILQMYKELDIVPDVAAMLLVKTMVPQLCVAWYDDPLGEIHLTVLNTVKKLAMLRGAVPRFIHPEVVFCGRRK
jgi:hypothetical protein